MFGIFAGAGFQSWRQYPPDGPVTASSLLLIAVVAALVAYLVGRRSARGVTATATAVATSTATAANTVQLAIINTDRGGSERQADVVQFPSEAAAWFASTTTSPALEVDGLELSELVEDLDEDEHELFRRG